MRFQELIQNNKKEEPNLLWNKKEKSQLLLMDLRSYDALCIEAKWKAYYKSKAKKSKYFMFLHKALNFTNKRMSLKKGLTTFPGYKRGTKGFILDNSFMDLLPEPEKSQAKHNVAIMDCHMVLFEHAFMSLPLEYIKYLK